MPPAKHHVKSKKDALVRRGGAERAGFVELGKATMSEERESHDEGSARSGSMPPL